MQNIKDPRSWYHRGKVLCLAFTMYDGVNYYHPVRPYTPGDYWDEMLVDSYLKRGEVVVIVDYGYIYDIPESYNVIPERGSQLDLSF